MAPINGDTARLAVINFVILSTLMPSFYCFHVYEREELYHLRPSVSEIDFKSFLSVNFIDEIVDSPVHRPLSAKGQSGHRRGRRRGKRGGALVRLRKRNTRAPLPSIFLANVRSLRHKIDELCCHISTRRDYSECCAYFITETWLDDRIPDSAMTPPGFPLFRQDRNFDVVDKGKGGGVCLMINKKWCTNSKVISPSCTPELETLSVKCRPFYLPREFGSIILTCAYIPPEVNATSAIDQLSDIVTQNENANPGAINIIAGDFNHTNLKKGLPKFYQHVKCSTRKDKTLDHCYTTIKDAYKSLKRAPLGDSDHNTVHLVPRYRQRLKQHKPIVKSVPQWSNTAIQSLQGCLARTGLC